MHKPNGTIGRVKMPPYESGITLKIVRSGCEKELLFSEKNVNFFQLDKENLSKNSKG